MEMIQDIRLKWHLKYRIQKNPTAFLDMIYHLLPENRDQVEMILYLMDLLVHEKKIDPMLLWKRMECPIYFKENHFNEFSKRDPLVGRMIRFGGLKMFNFYLRYKYGTILTAELLQNHDIFSFELPPVENYFDHDKWPSPLSIEEKSFIFRKYYSVYGMYYELFGDILQEKNKEILNRLIACQFNFNKSSTVQHLNRYLYVNRAQSILIEDDTMIFLFKNGLNPNHYITMILNSIWDELMLPSLAPGCKAMIQMARILIENGAKLKNIPMQFLINLSTMLEHHEEKLIKTTENHDILFEIECFKLQLFNYVFAKNDLIYDEMTQKENNSSIMPIQISEGRDANREDFGDQRKKGCL